MQEQINIPLDKTAKITCDFCGGEVFSDGYLLRKASRFLTGTSQDAIIPIAVFVCDNCGHVNNSLLPVQLRAKNDEAELPIQ